ncbi:hypothetical protein F7725_011106 [Dissostichus mawsoni]|uniref:Uncharacterized protein n=1 Tax=Dissostichus mawsoni TaxID=36200 RepID=A0A7J5Z821_DISMA|nr:hypothetical protein F7725_011106 [Dissostichus mawsoni]
MVLISEKRICSNSSTPDVIFHVHQPPPPPCDPYDPGHDPYDPGYFYFAWDPQHPELHLPFWAR